MNDQNPKAQEEQQQQVHHGDNHNQISDPIRNLADNTSSSPFHYEQDLQDVKTVLKEAEHAVEGAARGVLQKAEGMVKNCMTKMGGPDRNHADEEPDEVVDQAEWVRTLVSL